MAQAAGTAGVIVLDTLVLSCKVHTAETETTLPTFDSTVLCSTGKEFIAGVPENRFAASGFYDTAVNTGLLAATGTDKPFSYFPMGAAFGSAVWFQQALTLNFKPGSTVSGLVSFDVTAQNNGQIDMGYSLHALTAETTSSNSATHDDGAASTNGAAASLHVTEFSGFTNIAVDVRHSTDNFGANNNSLMAFTTATGTTSEIKTVTGTVARYIRVQWTKSGTGTATFAVGFARR